jgi:Flp pilus assembly pilin Flp
MSPRIKQLQCDDGGATAVEFAIIAPVFLMIVFGILQLSMLGFTVASLNYAVEHGARCNAVRSDCPDIETYYHAFGEPEFDVTPTGEACGILVTAELTYTLSVVAFQKSVDLSSSACFPDLKL